MGKKRITPQDALKASRNLRRENLRKLSQAYGGNAALAAALEVTESYLSQLIGVNPRKPITETTARKFEYRLKLANGSLDRE